MATLEKLDSPFAAQPGSLESPVPGDKVAPPEAPEDLTLVEQQRFNKSQASGAPIEREAGVREELSLFSDITDEDLDVGAGEPGVFSPIGEADLKATDPDFPFEPDVIGSKAQFQQFRDAKLRTQNLFTKHKGQTEKLLVEARGRENVKMHDGEFWIKNEGDEKFHKFDPKAYELIMDTVENFGRPLLEEVGLLAPELIGGALGGFPGAVTARTLAVNPVVKAVDWIGEQFGVPMEDMDMGEIGVNALSEAVIPFAGHHLGRFIPGTKSWRANREENLADHIKLSEGNRELKEIGDRLEQSGLVQKIPGHDFSYSVHQIHPQHPKIKELNADLRNIPGYINVMTQQGDAIGHSIEDTLRLISGPPGKKLMRAENLPRVVKDATGDILKAERKQLQRYKNNLKLKTKNGKLPISDDLVATWDELLIGNPDEGTRGIGYTKNPDGSYTPPSAKDIKDGKYNGRLGLANPNDIQAFVNTFEEIQKHTKGGSVTADGIEDVITAMQDMFGVSQGFHGTPIKRLYGRMSSQIRKQRREMYKAGYDTDVEKNAVDTVMDRYSKELESVTDLGKLLDGKIAQKNFIKQVFATGGPGISRLRGAQSILKTASPATWRDIKAEYIEQALTKHIDKKKHQTNFNAGQLKKLFVKGHPDNIGDEALDILFDNADITQKEVHDLLEFADTINQRTLKTSSENAMEEKAKTFLETLMQFRPAIARSMMMLFTYGGEGKAMAKMLDKKGVDEFLLDAPKNRREAIHATYNELIARWRINGVLDKVPDRVGVPFVPNLQVPIGQVPSETISRGLRGAVRDKTQKNRRKGQ